ncbi:arylsulfatase [Paraflavisolibacter sp. H34]|uniref:arylsulfatase n=1 Tax=Huijunlia imazamoxiresistens TaxID=3127457 RepID=UPI0030171F31
MSRIVLSLSLLVALFALLSLTTLQPKSFEEVKKPNIIVILADDMGYSDIGCFGSEIRTPHLDDMARSGLKLTQFYNASRCCPSRASLLTGLYQHQAGVGDMVNTRPQPAYQGYLNDSCVTIAEALKAGGYATFMTGKWHVGEKRPHWPLDRGFDRYFGLINGANSYFSLRPYRPRQKLTIALDNEEFVPGKGFYSTDAYTDYALKFLEGNRNSNKPFFLYLAYQAPHWPLHALPEDIARYRDRYAKGWDALRLERFRRMQQLGVLDKNAQLSPRDEHVPAWETASKEVQHDWQEKMAVYAAMVDRMDQNIGRLRQWLRQSGQEKNTLVVFLSDNGASYENVDGPGFTPEILEARTKPASDSSSFTAYAYPGANVSNTPFRYYKHLVYEGGIATPFVASFPGFIRPGRSSSQPAHVVDLMATCLDLAGVAYPRTFQNRPVKPTEGISLKPLLKGTAWKGHDALFWEHEGARAVRQGNWKLVSLYPENVWRLYDLKTDRSELRDLAAQKPQKVQQLAALYDSWATRAGVIPFKLIDRGEN